MGANNKVSAYLEAPTVGPWELSHITLLTMEALWAKNNRVIGTSWGEGDVMEFLWLTWQHKPWRMRVFGRLYQRVWVWRVGRVVRRDLEAISSDICQMVDAAWAYQMLPNNAEDKTAQKLDVAWTARMVVSIAKYTGWSQQDILQMPLSLVHQYKRAIYAEETGKQAMTFEDVESHRSVKSAAANGDADTVAKWLAGEL